MPQQQFNEISNQYADFVGRDPFRLYLHYPAIISALRGKDCTRLLDVGCGDGLLAELLARELAAQVTGYDIAPRQIDAALEREQALRLGNSFIVSSAEKFVSLFPFDNAVSVMVLSYAETRAQLAAFFDSTYRSLEQGGSFISVILNPHFSAFDQVIGRRRFTKLNQGQIQIEFLNQNGQTEFSSVASRISEEEMVTAVEESGFRVDNFKPLFASEEGKRALGEPFWKDCEQTQPYQLLSVNRQA